VEEEKMEKRVESGKVDDDPAHAETAGVPTRKRPAEEDATVVDVVVDGAQALDDVHSNDVEPETKRRKIDDRL
jgi:hypothetical protein